MLEDLNALAPATSWIRSEDIRPYVLVRQNASLARKVRESEVSWFAHLNPIRLNPLHVDNLSFVDQILNLEAKAFAKADMAMDRWVFYDCAILPGFVAGFAARTDRVPPRIRAQFPDYTGEWLPISLFIIIPSMIKSEWVAHNLCTINALLDPGDRFYGLGFLTKAYGLWYAHIDCCVGVTQWSSPAIKLHTYYGPFEILTAYTPAHSYAHTLTYRLDVQTALWPGFFTKTQVGTPTGLSPAGFELKPSDTASLREFQRMLEEGKRRYFLNPVEVRTQPIGADLTVYVRDLSLNPKPSS